MRKVLCNNSEHPRVFAHILDDGTVDIVRQDQRFTIVGESYTLIGTNPQGAGKTVLTIKEGKLIEDGIKFKEDEHHEENTGQGVGSEQPAGDTTTPATPDATEPIGTPEDSETGSGERKHTKKG